MPADYQKIREENVARYGWDTAVLDLLGQLYSERTHFIFELIQNAEDTVAKRADVWSDRQLRAGWQYLLRRAGQAD